MAVIPICGVAAFVFLYILLNMKKFIYIYSILVTAALIFGGVKFCEYRNRESEVVEIVRTITDTVVREVPTPVAVAAVRIDTCYLPIIIRDTVRDTVQVILPIERKEYRDSSYCAIVSGYRPNLDYIEIYRKTDCIMQTVKQPAGNSDRFMPFAVHLGAGIAATPKGLQPCVTVSIGVDLYRFKKRRNDR